MSQHYFETTLHDQPAVVLMGWDRPLQGYFLIIMQEGANEEDMLYSNLCDPALLRFNGLPPTLDYFKAKLSEFGLKVPTRMIQEIEFDVTNARNQPVWYDKFGNITRRD